MSLKEDLRLEHFGLKGDNKTSRGRGGRGEGWRNVVYIFFEKWLKFWSVLQRDICYVKRFWFIPLSQFSLILNLNELSHWVKEYRVFQVL